MIRAIALLIITVFLSAGMGYCQNLDSVKSLFLKGDYKSAIIQGEKVLAGYSVNKSSLDELYYILGLCYMQDGNYLRASDIFEIVIKEFRNSRFKDEAAMGMGDTYYLRGQYEKAGSYYKEILDKEPSTKLRGSLYYRLAQVALKIGQPQEARAYLDKLKSEFPDNLELMANRDLSALSASGIYYSVQTGSFSRAGNAVNLCNKLSARGYTAYLEEIETNGSKMYRVKVGRLNSRRAAEDLENRLSAEGYPTKITP